MRILLLLIISMNSFLFCSEKEGDSFAHFYQTKSGEMIMNPDNFNDSIKTFLLQENQFIIKHLLNKYEYLFEIGCGPSDRAADVVRFGSHFYGIDINKKYVDISNKSFKNLGIENKAFAEVFSAMELRKDNFPIPLNKKTLILFPFNLLGNLDDFHLVLDSIIDIGQDFCFSTYKFNDITIKARDNYYTNCGCKQVRYSTTPIGDLFDSKDGLHSAAFKIGYIVELLNGIFEAKRKTAVIEVEDLGGIGFMIYVHNIQNIEDQ